jgi:tetratricopeptide (TPR) repeat protein
MKYLLSTLLLGGCLLWASKSYSQAPAVAKMSLDAGTLDKAKEQIDKALANEKHVTKAKTWLYKGMIYTAIANDQTGIYKKMDDGTFATVAYEAFAKALELEPANKEAKPEMEGKLYPALLNTSVERLNAANKLLKDEKTDEANAKFAQAIKNADYASKIMPKDTLSPYLCMSAAYSAKNYDVFIKTSDALIAHPDTKEKATYCEYVASYYYFTAKDSKKALEYAQKGMKFGGTETLQKLIVELLNQGGNADEAINAVKENIKKNPNDAQNYFNLGVLLEKTKKYDEAIQAYDKAIQINNLPDAIYNAGALYFNKGAEIIKVVNDMSIEDYNRKSKAELAKVDVEFRKALPYFEKLYLVDAKNKSTLDILMQLYGKLKMTEKEEKMKKEREALGD